MRKRYRPAKAVLLAPPKAPRQYAIEIIALPTREQRHAALAGVPEHLRDWVAEYVTDYFAKRQYARRAELER